jgi:hypothetical protein
LLSAVLSTREVKIPLDFGFEGFVDTAERTAEHHRRSSQPLPNVREHCLQNNCTINRILCLYGGVSFFITNCKLVFVTNNPIHVGLFIYAHGFKIFFLNNFFSNKFEGIYIEWIFFSSLVYIWKISQKLFFTHSDS